MECLGSGGNGHKSGRRNARIDSQTRPLMFQGNQGVGYRGMFQVVEIARQGDRYIDVGTNIGPSIGVWIDIGGV